MNSNTIGLWGTAAGVAEFLSVQKALHGEKKVRYAESWQELTPEENTGEDSNCFGRIYAFPAKAEYASLPCFFESLSSWPRYEVYVCADCGLPLPADQKAEIEGTVFFRFSFCRMNLVQRMLKRFFDLVCGGVGLLVLSPVLLLCAVLVKMGSKGPVFYSQERIGKGGKPFRIYKFRSMRTDAEAEGPCLSSSGDPRITAWGNIMRRYRLDEIPQLWNAVKGDMAVVGYRPERAYFIERIVEKAPYYTLLYALKPGITSSGITTFGYAENVPQMIVRLSCDMAYMERLSLKEDLRILGRTCRVIVYGVGK